MPNKLNSDTNNKSDHEQEEQVEMGQAFAKVHIASRALERIKRGALRYLGSETGEALVGVAQAPSKRGAFPTMYILDTIPPMQDVVREWAKFEQGGDWEMKVFQWLNENWEAYRKLRRRMYGKSISAHWDLPLQHLGDWHKQPGMVAPSMGDFQTAKAFMKDNQLEHLLTPIITLAEEASHTPEDTNTLICEDVLPHIRLDFWGISKRSREFIPLEPVIALGYGLPRLPDVVWWLDDSRRIDLEIRALEKAGYDILDIAQHNVDELPPLETCFVLYRPNMTKMIIAITPHTYPKKAPQWKLAPLMRPSQDHDFLEALLGASEPVPSEWVAGWSGLDHALVDGARMIEAGLNSEDLA